MLTVLSFIYNRTQGSILLMGFGISRFRCAVENSVTVLSELSMTAKESDICVDSPGFMNMGKNLTDSQILSSSDHLFPRIKSMV